MCYLWAKKVIFDGKEPVEQQVEGAGAVNIMEFWTMLGYAIGFLIGVTVVVVRIILGCDRG